MRACGLHDVLQEPGEIAAEDGEREDSRVSQLALQEHPKKRCKGPSKQMQETIIFWRI